MAKVPKIHNAETVVLVDQWDEATGQWFELTECKDESDAYERIVAYAMNPSYAEPRFQVRQITTTEVSFRDPSISQDK